MTDYRINLYVVKKDDLSDARLYKANNNQGNSNLFVSHIPQIGELYQIDKYAGRKCERIVPVKLYQVVAVKQHFIDLGKKYKQSLSWDQLDVYIKLVK